MYIVSINQLNISIKQYKYKATLIKQSTKYLSLGYYINNVIDIYRSYQYPCIPSTYQINTDFKLHI